MKPGKKLATECLKALGEHPRNPLKELRRRIADGRITVERPDELSAVFSDADGPFFRFEYIEGAPRAFVVIDAGDLDG